MINVYSTWMTIDVDTINSENSKNTKFIKFYYLLF